jgi:hypothetical protein
MGQKPFKKTRMAKPFAFFFWENHEPFKKPGLSGHRFHDLWHPKFYMSFTKISIPLMRLLGHD